MKLRPLAALVVSTVVLVGLPTVSFAGGDQSRPVAPDVTSSSIGGVSSAAETATPSPDAVTPVTRPGTTQPGQGETPRRLAVLTDERLTEPFTVAGINWRRDASFKEGEVLVHVRVREHGAWSGWQRLTVPDEGPDAGAPEQQQARTGTAPLVSDRADGIQVRVETPSGQAPPDLKVTTVDPGASPADDDLGRGGAPASAHAAARTPAIITRAQWGADERLRGATTYNTTVKAIVIHHTAGTNSYSPEAAAAQVRGIYAYDTLGLGWSDIAYNFLVDKWGRVYEGRAGSITKAVRGAHAGGFNVDTMGIAAMGNYETASAPAAMVNAMAEVAGWKLAQYGRDVYGKARLVSQGGGTAKYAPGTQITLDAIAPHSDTGRTLCPGKYLYAQLGALRSKAAAHAAGSAVAEPQPAPKPAPAPVAPAPSPRRPPMSVGDVLAPSRELDSAVLLSSRSCSYRLVVQGDGNVVLYGPSNRVLWSSGTFGHPGTRLVMQSDGNLVAYTPSGQPAWHSGTAGNAGARLVLQTDGNLVLYRADGSPAWFTGWDRSASGPAAVPADKLAGGQQLTGGQELASTFCNYRLAVQTDGNVVVYAPGGRALWNAGTYGNPGARLVLQADGNLVEYTTSGRPAWHSGTAGNAGARLVLQTDGNLVLYRADGKPAWFTGADPRP